MKKSPARKRVYVPLRDLYAYCVICCVITYMMWSITCHYFVWFVVRRLSSLSVCCLLLFELHCDVCVYASDAARCCVTFIEYVYHECRRLILTFILNTLVLPKWRNERRDKIPIFLQKGPHTDKVTSHFFCWKRCVAYRVMVEYFWSGHILSLLDTFVS